MFKLLLESMIVRTGIDKQASFCMSLNIQPTQNLLCNFLNIFFDLPKFTRLLKLCE